MQTNKNISTETELYRKGQALLQAAHEYWKQYNEDVGSPGAVVWLENDNGHFILFTRGEYKQGIMAAANRECVGEPAMFAPFTEND